MGGGRAPWGRFLPENKSKMLRNSCWELFLGEGLLMIWIDLISSKGTYSCQIRCLPSCMKLSNMGDSRCYKISGHEVGFQIL